MIASRVRLLSATLAGLALSGAAAQAQAPSAIPARSVSHTSPEIRLATAPAGSIYGAVLDDAGAPVEGAVVSALGGSTAFAVTDGAGQYRITELPAGPYVVRVHRDGYAGARSTLVNVRPAAKAPSSFTLRRESAATTVAAAGVAAEAGPRDESPLAWRLRRLTRSVLKDETPGAPALTDVDAAWFGDDPPSFFSRAYDVSARLASSVLSTPFTGQVNLLTATAYDDSGEIVDFGPANGVAFFALGAPVGDQGDWSARAAMNGGDLSSWTMAGVYTPRLTARHQVSVGVTYSMQAYRGGNFAALQAVPEGHRKVGAISATHDIRPFRNWRLGYGARYEHYDYLDGHGLLSPSARLVYTPSPGWELQARTSLQQVAPGAEEFVTPTDSLWALPQRTFAPLGRTAFGVERVQHYELGATRRVGDLAFSLRGFQQFVENQLVTVFGAADPARLIAAGGHYGLASAGNAAMQGWAFGMMQHVTPHVQARVDYTIVNTRWDASSGANRRALLAFAPQAIRAPREQVHDVSASVDAEVPQTDTRFVLLYKVSTGFAGSLDGIQTANGRFDIQLRQGLPFLEGLGDWEMLLGMRSLFRPALDDRSIYDELLVVRAPKRVVGGLQVRF